MGKRRLSTVVVVVVVVLIIWTSVSLVEMCFCDDDPTERPQSWTDWASGRLAEGLGRIKSGNEKKKPDQDDLIGKAEESATINSAISDASKYASDKAGKAASEAAELYGLENAKNMYDKAKRRTNLASNEASEYELSDKVIGKRMDYRRDNAARKRDHHRGKKSVEMINKKGENGDDDDQALAPESGDNNYKQAQRKLQELYEMVEGTPTEKSKSAYEAAKGNLSRATGNLGASIRENSGEL